MRILLLLVLSLVGAPLSAQEPYAWRFQAFPDTDGSMIYRAIAFPYDRVNAAGPRFEFLCTEKDPTPSLTLHWSMRDFDLMGPGEHAGTIGLDVGVFEEFDVMFEGSASYRTSRVPDEHLDRILSEWPRMVAIGVPPRAVRYRMANARAEFNRVLDQCNP